MNDLIHTVDNHSSARKAVVRGLKFPLANLALAIAAINCVSSVNAQTDDSDEGLRILEEVTVTARRRAENMQEVPVAVSALSAGRLKAEGVTELGDLGTQVPSVRISNAGASPTIR